METILYLSITLLPAMIITFMLERSERKIARDAIEYRKQWALKVIVHEDISADSQEKKEPLQERVLRYYEKDEITPELIGYFRDNYLSTLEAETRKIAEQKALDEKRERDFQNLEERQKAQLDAYKSVKELSK